jgi:hypothetical protein
MCRAGTSFHCLTRGTYQSGSIKLGVGGVGMHPTQPRFEPLSSYSNLGAYLISISSL